jgi:hypothetical protein
LLYPKLLALAIDNLDEHVARANGRGGILHKRIAFHTKPTVTSLLLNETSHFLQHLTSTRHEEFFDCGQTVPNGEKSFAAKQEGKNPYSIPLKRKIFRFYHIA